MSQKDDQAKSNPSAFISYSWDGEEHRQWVIALATKLRENGVAVTLDHWHLPPGADKTHFMERSVAESDHVLLICTPTFKTKAEGRLGGVGWETSIVTGELANDLTQTKFVPILRSGTFRDTLPRWLANRVGVDLTGQPYSVSEFERLLRKLHNELPLAPPIGPRPTFEQEKSARPDVGGGQALSLDFSSRAQLIIRELSLRAFPVVEESRWANEVELSVAADTTEIDSIFSRMRGCKEPLIIAYGFDVALATLKSLDRVRTSGGSFWKAKFDPSRTDFANDMEMGSTSVTADQFAEKRARRILLNENPMSLNRADDDPLGRINEAMDESLVQGLNSLVKVEHSGLLDLYTDFRAYPNRYLEIAWIAAITDLKLSASVQHINHLALALNNDVLAVDFAGRRHKKYSNVPAYEIAVQGTLQLA